MMNIMARFLSRRSYEVLLQYCHHQKIYNSLLPNSRSYAKKTYKYDLDSLIIWNKDTERAFGSPKKPTKPGKKTKNGKIPKKDVTNSLETSSTLSACLSISHDDDSKTGDVGFNMTSSREEKLSLDNIPEYCLEETSPESPTHGTSGALKLKDNFRKDLTEDGIYIPEIKPVPQTSSNDKKSKVSLQPSVNNPSINHKSDKMTGSVASMKKNSNRAAQNNFLRKSSNDLDLHQQQTPEDTKPITSFSSPTSSKSNPLSDQVTCMPIEAPDSFSLITDFPLTLQNKDALTQNMLDKAYNFRTDVNKIALRNLPSVKVILNKTMPELNRFFLNRWREGMIKELGQEGFKLHTEATIKRGINLHANVMEFLSGKPLSEIQIMPDNEGHWASLQSAIKLIKDVYSLETDVQHPFLNYRGVFDCIARYKDSLCIVDWKTSKKPRPLLKNTYDDPIQIAAYVGAFNAMPTTNNTQECDQINHGLIVCIYPDGSPAHIHMMNQSDCENYWYEWTERLYQFYVQVYTSNKIEGQCKKVISKSV